MKQYSTRDVQKNISTLLSELPFEIIVRGEVVAVVSKPIKVVPLVPSDKPLEPKKKLPWALTGGFDTSSFTDEND